MVELGLLEQLAAFARRGTLSAAAEELHISQPALSQSMKKLEADLGVPLFERTRNRLRLNETGVLAAQLGEALLEQSRDLEERLRLFDRSRRTISLGTCAPAPLWDLSPRLARLYPQMTVSTELKNPDQALLDGLARGAYQLVVTHTPPGEGLYGLPFQRERLFLSVPPCPIPWRSGRPSPRRTWTDRTSCSTRTSASGTTSAGSGCPTPIFSS